MARRSAVSLLLFLSTWLAVSGQAQESPPEPVGPPAAPQPSPAPPPAAVPSPGPRPDLVSLNFNRADLVEVIHVLAQHLRLTYTIDPEVKGLVTIHSTEPLKREDLLPIFHQVLRMNGAVAVRSGEMYRIAPIREGKGLARPVGVGREDGYALQVVAVRFFSVGEMKRLLTPFVTPGGEVLEYARGNFLIIVDLPSNIQRLMEIRDLIDVQVFAGTRMEIYQPRVASAEELASEMGKVMQAYASSAAQAEGFAAQFLALPRINQLLVISHSEAAWSYVKRWLERIDTVGEGPGRKIFIYPVENGKATDLADILNQALGIAAAGRRESPRTLQDLHRGLPGTLTAPGAPRSPLAPYSPSSTPLGPQTLAPEAAAPFIGAVAPTPAPPPAAPRVPLPAPRPAVPPAPEAKAQEQLRIVPDPATNSLIIYGTAQEFQNIRNILKDLDIMPRQVLLDVLVAEVTLADDLRFGVEFEIKRRSESIGQIGTIESPPLPVTGLFGTLSAGAVTQGLTTVVGRGRDFRAIINALMGDSRVKVLSSPTVLATDNRPARIQVGTEEPVPTGTVQSPVSGGTITSSTTIQYRNTGRILTLIPQVNSQGLVHLEIKAEVSQRGADVQVGGAGNTFPSFDTRDAETTAVVQDGETLVIGGIITDRRSRSRVGIPYLMDLPILGRFFGTTTDEVDRTELVMLITPRVIRNVGEARSVTDEFKERLSTVTREIERMRKEKEKTREEQKSLPPRPSSPPSPQKESREVPRRGIAPIDALSPAPNAAQPVNEISPEQVAPAQRPVESDATVAKPAPVAAMVASVDKIREKARREETALPPQAGKQPRVQNGPEKPRVILAAPKRQETWTVQVAVFATDQEAKSLTGKLKAKGYDAYVVSAEIHGRTLYRARVGRLATREEATELRDILKTKEKFATAFIPSR